MRLFLSTTLVLGLFLGPFLGPFLRLTIPTAHAGGPSVVPPSAGGKPVATAAELVTKRVAGEKAITDCMQMWDAGTHMTKQEWARTCRRVQNRLHQFDAK
jgi:hypothetical protein